MKRIACISAFVAISTCLPAAAQSAVRLSPEQLMARAAAQNVCGSNTLASAVYESPTSNLVKVTCQAAGSAAEVGTAEAGTAELGAAEFGAGMGIGGIAAGGLVFLVALGAGGGTPATTSTTGTN